MSRRSALRPRGDLLLTAIAALVTAVVCFAPLHQQAMIQALAQHELDQISPLEAGLRLDSSSTDVDASGLLVTVPVDHDLVLGALPRQVREHTDAPIVSVRTSVTTAAPDGRFASGPLLSREGACDHLKWVDGRCPEKPREVAVSRGDAKAFGWAPGDRLRVLEELTGMPAVERGHIGLRVVGVYQQEDLEWWESEALTGTSGTAAVPGGHQVLHDTFVVPTTATLGARQIRWADATHRFDLRLDRDGVDSAVVAELGGVTEALAQSGDMPYATTVRSALPEIAAELDRARSQAGVVVPLLVAQVALVGWVMLAVALQAAATQRRPRVAVARLRGNGVRTSRRLLAAELLPATLAGVVAGMVLALPLGAASRRWVLPPGAPFEVPLGYWGAAATAVVAVVVTVVVIAHGTARVPLAELLQRSPARRPVRQLGAGTVAVAAAAAALATAVLTGGVTGPVALLVPAVVALAAGLVLARLLTLVAVPAGRWLLAHRRASAGLGLLQLARRPATVQVASLLTVGVALLVFAADAHATAERNRELAARQELGAPVRLALAGRDVVAVRDALAEVDPRGELATALVEIPTPAAGTTVGILPEELLRVGFAGDDASARAALGHLSPPEVPPTVLTGARLRGRAQWFTPSRTARRTPPRVTLMLIPNGESPVEVSLGTATTGSSVPVEADLPCRDGCVLTGIRVTWGVSISTVSHVELTGLRVDGRPVTFGSAGDWQVDTQAPLGHLAMGPSGQGSATLLVENFGATSLLVRHVVDPALIPAVLTHLTDSPVLNARALQGDVWPVVAVTHVRRVAGVGNDSAIVDLTTLTRRGEHAGGSAQVHVLVADPARVSEVRAALAAHDQHVSGVRTVAQAEADLAASVPGWSLRLALLVGGAGLLLSGTALLLVGATTRRSRARDLAALRLTGAPRAHLSRISRWEVLPMVAAATLAGAACGVGGAASALGSVPLFATTPEVPTLDLSTPWAAVAITTTVALAGLLLLALATAGAAVRQARLDLVRSTL